MIQTTLAIAEIKALVRTSDRSEAQILAALGALIRLPLSKAALPKGAVTARNALALALAAPWPSAARFNRPRVLRCPNRRYTLQLGTHAIQAGRDVQLRARAVLGWMRSKAKVGLGPVDKALYRSVEDTKVLYTLILGLQRLNTQAGRIFSIRPKNGFVDDKVLRAAGAAWRNGMPFRVIGELDASQEHKLPGRIAYPGAGSLPDLPSHTRLTSGFSVWSEVLAAHSAIREFTPELHLELSEEDSAHRQERVFSPQLYAELGIGSYSTEGEVLAAFYERSSFSLDGLTGFLHEVQERKPKDRTETQLHGVTLPPAALVALEAWRHRHLE